ncbi:MAG: hypothetical protein U1E16_07415 [Hyphomicrobiales bacterium]
MPNWGNGRSLELVSQRGGLSTTRRQFLVFVVPSGGVASALYGKLDGERNFDIAVRLYEPPGLNEKLLEGAEFVMTGGLSKFHAAALFIAKCNLQEAYDGYFFLDGDLEFDAGQLSQFLTLVHAARFDLAQPAVTRDSYSYWRMAYHQPGFLFRETSFVEVMAPYMSRAALTALFPTFERSISSYGLDFVWPSLLGNGRIGVVDAFQVRHTERVDLESGAFYRYLATLGINPVEEGRRLELEYGIRKVRPHSRRGYIRRNPDGSSPFIVSVPLPHPERFTRSQAAIDVAMKAFSKGPSRPESELSMSLKDILKTF